MIPLARLQAPKMDVLFTRIQICVLLLSILFSADIYDVNALQNMTAKSPSAVSNNPLVSNLVSHRNI